MHLMKVFKNQKGFTLTELMISVALLGGVSLITMKVMEEQSGNQSYLKATAEITKTVAMLQSTLNDPAKCKEMLGGIVKPSDLTSKTEIPELKYLVRGEMHTILGAPVDPSPAKQDYSEFYLQKGDIALMGSEFGNNVADLVINFRIKKRALSLRGDDANDEVVTRRLSLVGKFTPAVISCGPVLNDASKTAKQKLCESLIGTVGSSGGVQEAAAVWDDTTGTCTFKAFRCPVGEVPKRIISLGHIECEPAVNRFKIEEVVVLNQAPIDCSATNRFRLVNAGGKLTIACDGSSSYSWIATSWFACDAPCGGGTRTRTVECREIPSGNISAGSCPSGTKPAVSEACNTTACPTSGTCSYQFKYPDGSEDSATISVPSQAACTAKCTCVGPCAAPGKWNCSFY